MMALHLNGLQRIGIIASVIWLVGGGAIERNTDIRRAGESMGLAYRICTEREAARNSSDFSNCDKAGEEAWRISLVYSWWNAALVAFGPIILAWPLAYGILGLWRWVKRAFEEST
jgi:hypothetical protein